MKLKLFQKQDLARAALKDRLILGWDTGLGKTWAMFLWPLLKVGFDQVRCGWQKARQEAKSLILVGLSPS